MTIEKAKQQLVSIANSEIGCVEGKNNWNKYAAEMNEANAYGWNVQNQPYCDIFTDWCFYKAFGLDLAAKMTYQPKGGFSALCSASANFYKSHGAWYAGPAVGDQVFFIVDGGINHTGIVTNVGIGAITTVEGNSSDSVARRTYPTGSPKIAGYGRPDWSVVADYNPTSLPDDPAKDAEPERPGYLYHTYQYTVRINLLKLGDYGPQVKNIQAMLAAQGYDCPVNGEFDDATYSAVKEFQEDSGLDADGEFGGKTFESLYGP